MKPFFDTNVLVYAATADDPHKQAVAQRLLADTGLSNFTISTQVMAEAYNVLTHKKRWVPHDALQVVQMFSEMQVVALGAEGVLTALALAARHHLSTWDAKIVQAALEAGCDTLFSEDLQDGRRFGTLQIVNPFGHAAHEAEAGFTEPPAQAAPRRRGLSRPPARRARRAPARRARRR